MTKLHSCLVAVASMFVAGAAHADITAADVKQVMAEHDGEVRACYEKHAKKQRDASGKVTLDIGVTPAGRVDKVDIDAPGVEGDAFSGCVDKKVKAWKFPENDGTVVTIPYKFFFADAGHS